MSAPVSIQFVAASKVYEGADWTTEGIVNSPHAPGTSAWLTNQREELSHIAFVCPCGCKSVCSLPVTPAGSPRHWKWNGDKLLPTLQPSIQRLSGCRWHGFLTNGVFTTC